MSVATVNSYDEAMSLLAKTDCTIAQLTQAINFLEKTTLLPTVKIGISSTVTMDLLGTYLRKQGFLNNTRIELVNGNYDDHVGDVDMFAGAGVNQMILVPFFDNLLPSFEAQLQNLSQDIVDSKEDELRQRYRIVFDKARDMHAVYLAGFHRISAAATHGQDLVADTVKRFNQILLEEARNYSNIKFINTKDIISTIGQAIAFDHRFYFRSKSPYSSVYMDKLAMQIAAQSRGFGSYFYKVLVLDCDNTLWGGVVGEDQFNGIKLGPHNYPDNIFWRMQHEFVALEKQGVLLALLSKNNLSDIDEVICKHPHMVLKNSNIVIKKINWDNKPSNLCAIAQELNVGLDSIVFLDDSSFECELMRQQLPMVKTIQVPKVLSEYCKVVANIKSLFLAGGITSKIKTQQYRQRANAEKLKSQTKSHEEYLTSLELKVELTCNDQTNIVRISELSQKTNQFNLTTQRYSVTEIKQMMADTSYAVYTFTVNDKFGNAGLTGAVIVHYNDDTACIDNFFMSCRIIGRGIENVVWHQIFEDARIRKCATMSAKFIPSLKNAQVKDFYSQLGFLQTLENSKGIRQYCVNVADFIPPVTPWIKLTYVK